MSFPDTIPAHGLRPGHVLLLCGRVVRSKCTHSTTDIGVYRLSVNFTDGSFAVFGSSERVDVSGRRATCQDVGEPLCGTSQCVCDCWATDRRRSVLGR